MRSATYRIRAATVATLVVLGLLPNTSRADVIVLANRTDRPLPIRFTPRTAKAYQLTLQRGDVVPIFADGKGHVEFASAGKSMRYLLDTNCAYYFGRAADGRIELQKIGLGEDGTALTGRQLPGSAVGPAAVVKVKIAVDEEEPARRVHWERRLRRRVETASAILEKFCGVKLEVVATAVWNSDNDTNDLIASLGELESEVPAEPGRLAIGFTSQYQFVPGRTHMAGTRGPLHSHILAREGSPQISEAEKLEFLVHELGHFLGAAHSPERGSVMRPVLGDNRAGRSDFQIQFDPVNALAVAMVGEEIRRRDIGHISELLPATKGRLRQIYTELAKALPDDPAGYHYAQLIGSSRGAPLAVATKQVLQAIVKSAAANRALPEPPHKGLSGESRRVGDELTTHLVRQAAEAAARLPNEVAPQAFLLALAIGLDDSKMLATIPGVSDAVAGVEAPSERMARLTLLGEPTLRGRRDFVPHFFVSAYIAATLGSDAANAAGFAKELLDAQGPSGFSFGDIAADRAGARFGSSVAGRRFPLAVLAKSFETEVVVPSTEGLPEALSSGQFKAKYGGAKSAATRQQIAEIDRRISELPPYKASDLKLTP